MILVNGHLSEANATVAVSNTGKYVLQHIFIEELESSDYKGVVYVTQAYSG